MLLPAASSLLLLVGALASCSSGGSSGGPSTTPGSVVDHPDASSATSKSLIVDPNSGGGDQELRLVRMYWGRLVDIYDRAPDGTRTLRQKNFVIGPDVRDDGINFLLETNPVTQGTDLVILREADSPSSGYVPALLGTETGVAPISVVGLEGGDFLSMVPRNAAVVLHFNDLLDPELITSETVRLFVGSPPTLPFEARIFADTNHGDVIGGGASRRFRSTRIIVDTTVSELESFESEEPIPVNGVGLPPSVNIGLRNLVVRIPSVEKASVGQRIVLRNLSGHAMAVSGNGPVDFTSPTVDIVRAARSGGPNEVTGDQYNGFLRDELAPEIIGRQPFSIDDRPVLDPSGNDERDFILPRSHFLAPFCSVTPQVGDVIKQAGIFLLVRELPAAPDDGVVTNMQVRLLLGEPGDWPNFAVGAAEFLSTFDPIAAIGKAGCFLQILPTPSGFPLEPTVGLDTDAQITVRFSEPMDPASVTAFDSLSLTRIAQAQFSDEFVIGRVIQSQDLQSFTLVPDLPLAHVFGEAESYFLNLAAGDRGPTDLAGNHLLSDLPQVRVAVDPEAATQINGGRVTRFTALDEDLPIGDEGTGPLPEWTGQHLYDLPRELIRARPVLRFEANADRTQPVVSLHSAFLRGVQTPLSGMGSVMQTVWRYADVGFSLTDVSNFNVDVEGIWWSPVGGAAVADFFPRFEMVLGHSLFLPDEYIDPGSAFPNWPLSGLKRPYLGNYLDVAVDPPKVVHVRSDGYSVDPANLRTSATGIRIMPYPMNRNKPALERVYYTWRDTSILERGADGLGAGVDIEPLCKTLAQGTCAMMGNMHVETIGLPLLMEFRCWPDDEAIGLNAFDINIAANSSARPNFRAFSTGGLSQSGPVRRDPDTETDANGGFNPLSMPPGQSTPGLDNTFYIGALDLITRISRSYSVWFAVTGEGITLPSFNPPVVEPRPELQPTGTKVDLHFRGATAITHAQMIENALTLDGYGDFYLDPNCDAGTFCRNTDRANPSTVFLNNDSNWHADVSRINGATYYQIRITFTGNAVTGTFPELSALGLTWQNL